MAKRRNLLRVICLVLAVCLLFGGCSAKRQTAAEPENADETAPQYTAKANDVRKTETVYVTLDAHGNAQNTVVSDWLHTSTPETYIQDKSDLQGIQNVKSDILPLHDGENLIWQMPTTDLYYQGTSEKELPVSFQVHYYYLDEEIEPEALAGKTGPVRIEIEMQNNYSETRKIGGKTVTVYNPVVVVGGLVLPESEFQFVESETGLVAGDGTKEFVLFAGLPGMNDSLGLRQIAEKSGEDLPFSDTFTVTAQAINFKLENMYFAVLPVSALADMPAPASVEELKQSLGQLKDLENAVKALDPQNVLGTFIERPQKITELTSMLHDAMTLYQSNAHLLSALSAQLTPENIKALESLSDTQGNSKLPTFLKLLADPQVQKFLQLLPSASGELKTLAPMLKGLSEALSDPQVKKELDALPQTAQQLSRLQADLEKNQALVDSLLTLADANKMQAFTNALQSADGKKLIEQLTNGGAFAEHSDVILEKTASTLDFGKQFKIYSDAPENAQTAVAFLFKTPSIQEQPPEQVEQTTEKTGWFSRVFGGK